MSRISINPFDAAWFHVEKQDAPAHFGPLLILSPPSGAPDTFVTDFFAEWRAHATFAAPFNYRLRKYPVPTWEVLPDSAIDIAYHLRYVRLPEPGGERELGELISRLHSDGLDPSRPLWEVHVIDGLAGGRFAIFMKFHHGQIDGVGAAKFIDRVFTADPDARDMLPPWATGIRGNRSVSRPRATQAKPGKLVAARDSLAAVGSATSALVKFVKNARGNSVPGLTAPFQAPTTILNGRIGSNRRFATQHYDLARIKAVAKAAGVTVNDVYLSMAGGALRRYLAENGGIPAGSLVGQIPVNVRVEGDSGVGNALAFIYAKLGTDIADPLARLYAVHESSSAGKAVHESLPAKAVAPFTMLLVGPYISQVILGLGGRVKPAANLVISNVPGPRERLYFNGIPVDEIYGPSVLFHGQALNVTMSSYAGQLDIGFTGCDDTLPSMQHLAVYTGKELETLEAVVARTGAPLG